MYLDVISKIAETTFCDVVTRLDVTSSPDYASSYGISCVLRETIEA